MQSQPEAPERVVLTSPLGSHCGSQGHRKAVTEDLCGAGGLALCSLPGTSVPLTSQGAWLHLRPEDNGGRGSSLCVSSARASPWRRAQCLLGWGFWDVESLAFLDDAQT